MAVLLLCLGLGIGVNTIMFSVFNATVFRGPSARDAGRLVQIEPGNGNQIFRPSGSRGA